MFFPKHREGFLVNKRLPCTHHNSYIAHIHHIIASTYTADLHHTTAATPLIYTMQLHRAHLHGLHTPCGALRGSCVSKSSRCGPVQIFSVAGEPSRCFQRAPALWRSERPAYSVWNQQLSREGWRVERPENSVWNQRPSRTS